jgi:hypothetical protein
MTTDLEEFLEQAGSDSADTDSFRNLVQKAIDQHGLENLAERTKHPPGMLRRWAKGTAKPHPIMEEYILKSIRNVK